MYSALQYFLSVLARTILISVVAVVYFWHIWDCPRGCVCVNVFVSPLLALYCRLRLASMTRPLSCSAVSWLVVLLLQSLLSKVLYHYFILFLLVLQFDSARCIATPDYIFSTLILKRFLHRSCCRPNKAYHGLQKMSLATAKSLNLWCKEGPSKLSYPLVCFSWLGSVKWNNMDQKWHCQISRYEAWKNKVLFTVQWWYQIVFPWFFVKCTPWYLYGILWYMSKNMVTRGTFLLAVPRWDTEIQYGRIVPYFPYIWTRFCI